MATRPSAKELTLAALAGGLLFISPAASGDPIEWYWINDAGGTWNEPGVIQNWTDSTGTLQPPETGDPPAVEPGEGDSAFLVLPYQFAFCPPGQGWEDGNCFTQPVPVSYRSDSQPNLSELIIESQNILAQREEWFISVDQLDLISDVEIVGGSGRAFDWAPTTDPPPYRLPDPPGIFPVGTHLQDAGTNTVNQELRIGGVAGSTGRYELHGGTLSVSGVENIGVDGDGSLLQTGGLHTVTGELHLGSGAGNGSYSLRDGLLQVAGESGSAGIVGIASGENSTAGFTVRSGHHRVTGDMKVGWGPNSSGSYAFSDAGDLIVSGDLSVGVSGEGEVVNVGGSRVEVGRLILGEEADGVGTYRLGEATLEVSDTTTVGQAGRGDVIQSGGRHEAVNLRLAEAAGSVASYDLLGGATLDVSGTTTVGGGARAVFTQTGGLHETDDLVIARDVGSDGDYSLSDGTLKVLSEVQLAPGGTGGFAQSGGSHLIGTAAGGVFGTLTIGADGPRGGYVMSGGSLRVDDLKLSRNAIFIQDGTAASTTVHNDLTLFDGSVLLFSAGDFTVEGDAFVHSDLPGGVDHRDGAMTVDGALTLGEDETDSGHYMLRGDHETSTLDVHGNEIIGAAGRGSFEQVGGTHTTHGWLVLGEQAGSDGTYDLRFSDLIVGDPALHVEERIGWLGEGTFDHPDGSHTVYGHLILGAQDDGEGNRVTEGDGRGTYDLRLFGKLEVNGQETIGLYGQGTLNQSVVSTHTVNGDLVVGSGAGSTGVYDLENGVLDVSGTLTVGRRGGGTFTQGVLDTLPALLSVETSSLMIGDEQVGSGVFELNGGELNVISQLTIGNSGDGVFTHNGGTVTAGNLDIGLETGSSGKYEMFGADSRLTVSGRTLVGNDDWAVTPANDASFWHREGEVDSQLVQVYRDAYYRLGSNDLGEPATLTSVETRVLDGGYFSLEPSGTHDVDSLQILGRREFSEDGGLQYFRSAYVNWGGDLNAGSCEVGRWGRYTQYTSSGHRLSYADCGEDSMHNQGTIEIFGEGTSTLEGAIHNHALFQVDDTTALLPGTLNNHDRVLVSNSSVTMGSLNVTADGYVVADAGTSIRIDGHFSNSSEQNALWDTDRAALILAGGVGMSITLAGEDQGISRDGLLDNFAWGRVSVLDGTEVEFQDGNPANDGTALYMRILDIEDRDSLDFENLVIAIFSGDASLYYDPTRSENDYLGGLVWRFAQGGGFLGPVVIPEPSTAWLLGLGLALLTRRRRRPRSSPRR